MTAKPNLICVPSSLQGRLSVRLRKMLSKKYWAKASIINSEERKHSSPYSSCRSGERGVLQANGGRGSFI